MSTHRSLSRMGGFMAASLVLLVLRVEVLAGQDAVTVRRQRVLAEQTDSILAVRPPRSVFNSTIPTGFVEVEDGDNRATISGGWRLAGVGWPNFTAKLEASTPLGEGDDPVSFGGHGGLSSGTTLGLSLTGTRWKHRLVMPDSMTRWCQNVQREARARGDARTLRGIVCDSKEIQPLADSMSDELYGRYLVETAWTEPWIFDVNGGVGRTDFDFMDATTFAPGSDQKYGWTFGADLGRYQGSMLWSGGVHYRSEYQARSKAEICLPVGTAGALRCRNSSLGPPTRAEAWTADVQMRGFFGGSRRFGVNPVVEVDLRKAELVARLPIYFLADRAGALIGGVTPSYSSHADEHWGFNVFLGAKAPLRLGL